MNKISAVVITKNEETNIQHCLKSIRWVDEIIVYDSGSTDRTVELAKEFGAQVHIGEWLGFGATKKKATSLANNHWILSIDADEVVSDLLAEEIKLLLQSKLSEDTAYLIPRKSYFLNRWITHGGWYPDYQKKFFNRLKSNWDNAEIHEKVISKNSLKMHRDLHHFVFKNIEHQVQTNNRYSTLLAKQLFDAKKFSTVYHILFKPMVKFFECYFFKCGFLDGYSGFVIARNASYSVFLKWTKLKEMHDQKNT